MLQICMACTTAFSVGAERCPQCGSVDWIDEGTEFPAEVEAPQVKSKRSKES